jgi:hypothetical protein
MMGADDKQLTARDVERRHKPSRLLRIGSGDSVEARPIESIHKIASGISRQECLRRHIGSDIDQKDSGQQEK